MTDTACPSCDAPAPARARRCARCGYEFVEHGGGAPGRPQLGRGAAAIAAVAAIAVAGIAAALVVDGGDDDASPELTPIPFRARAQLEVISDRPLSTPAAERLLEERFLPVPDDDEADVRCSAREARPAHSIRRCFVHYPGGTERRIVLLTNAGGAEVVSER